MKRKPFTLEHLEQSKCASLNHGLIEELKGVKKVKRKREPSDNVVWMWRELSHWAVKNNIEVVKELKFHPERKWRFDFALPKQKIAIEYDGLNSKKSGHTTLLGYTKDTEKINEAQVLGWKVIRFTVKNYKEVIKTIENLVR